MNITFNELRRIKDHLPAGSIKTIAERLHLSEDTVRNYFGGSHYPSGECVGFHVEQGPDGGIVALDDTTILDMAVSIINENDHVVN
jgi:Response regulator containing a CheY-like receiver domain and an HTH DNA-binding domain